MHWHVVYTRGLHVGQRDFRLREPNVELMGLRPLPMPWCFMCVMCACCSSMLRRNEKAGQLQDENEGGCRRPALVPGGAADNSSSGCIT